jgi:Tfp pilus assembly protein PilX
MKSIHSTQKQRKGIAIYISVTITAALVLVSFAILNLAIKQIGISSAGRDSQAAFYAADSGIECALFWDLKNSTVPGVSAFATSSPLQTISCNNQIITVSRNGASSTFNYSFTPNPYCVSVTVAKDYVGEQPTTLIESRGYNSCIAGNSRRVERAVLVNY